MNGSTDNDWYSVRYLDDGLLRGRKVRITAPHMQKERMLGFLAIQIQKKKRVVGIRKNNVELGSKTVAALIQEAKKKRE